MSLLMRMLPSCDPESLTWMWTLETKEPESPKDVEDPIPDSPRSNVQREEHSDHVPNAVDLVEPVLPLERPVFAPLVKRRPAWL